MKHRISIPVLISYLFLTGCPEDPEIIQDLSDLTALSITSPDTVLMLVGDEKELNVTGTFIEVTENIITNSGAIIDTVFLDTYSEEYTGQVNSGTLNWYSSDPQVATVSSGIVSAQISGSATVWAESGGIFSDSIVVKVSGLDQQPALVLDPPPVQLVFQDSSYVSGDVTPGMNLELTLNDSIIEYGTEGDIFVPVALDTGVNLFTIEAVNTDNGLSDSKEKTIIYYSFDQAGIEGEWQGETLGRPFHFEIYNLLGVYIIDGTMTVDVTMLGGPLIVENIVIYGLIRLDGTIDVEAHLDESGVTVAGSMNGYFQNSGFSKGNYSLKITVNGVASTKIGAGWTAEKLGQE